MKCPKCSYVSFDFNLSCPKCGKDISAEQSKLNIFAFRPEAPFLLGGLVGESGENNIAMSVAGSSPRGFARATGQGGLDSSGFETGEISFENSENFDLSADEGSSPQDTADFELGREAKPVELKESPIEDLALESDTLSIEQVDEDDIIGDDIIPAAGEPEVMAGGEDSGEIDLDALDLDSKEGESGEEDIHLSLDDLKVGDSGELEIDELTLDEIPLGDEVPLEKSTEKAHAAKLEMEDEGEAINLDDLELDLDLEEEEKRA